MAMARLLVTFVSGHKTDDDDDDDDADCEDSTLLQKHVTTFSMIN